MLFIDPKKDRDYLVQYIETFAQSIGMDSIDYDILKIREVIAWSADDGHYTSADVSDVSIFRKIGTFVAYFVSEKPIYQPFTSGLLPSEILGIENHQNAIIGFAVARYSLHNATIIRNGKEIILTNEIDESDHSYIDIINALAQISAPGRTRLLLSALFEQMAYRTNPHSEYGR